MDTFLACLIGSYFPPTDWSGSGDIKEQSLIPMVLYSHDQDESENPD